jgi:hypothetical protein
MRPNQNNRNYLKVKKDELGHLLDEAGPAGEMSAWL